MRAIKNFHSSQKNKIWHYVMVIFLALMAIVHRSIGQDANSTVIRIGEPIPEGVFERVYNWPTGKYSTKRIARPTILFFFSMGCKSSFERLPEVNELYCKYKKYFDLIVVGIDRDDDVQKAFQLYRKKYELNFPIAFDKVVHRKFDIWGVPHAIWINKEGVVQAVTNRIHEEHLVKFIDGEKFAFIDYSAAGKLKLRDFDDSEPFLVNGNGGSADDFLQRSLLARWRIGMPRFMPWAKGEIGPLEGFTYLQVIGRELADLYRIAYFGRTYAWHTNDSIYGNYHFSPILEMEDTSLFQSNFGLGENLFCYSQVLPPEKRTPAQMMSVMQKDLENFFGYKASIETREMPYLRLIATDRAKKRLPTKGEPSKFSTSVVHFRVINKPISRLISFLSYKLNLTVNDLPLLDETGIEDNIDISFDAVMTDFEDVKRALKRHGLSIVPGKRPMKVIVIGENASE